MGIISGVVLMSNGVELPIGRSKVKEVKDFYTKFMIMKVHWYDSV